MALDTCTLKVMLLQEFKSSPVRRMHSLNQEVVLWSLVSFVDVI